MPCATRLHDPLRAHPRSARLLPFAALLGATAVALVGTGCHRSNTPPPSIAQSNHRVIADARVDARRASLPLALVADVDLPGRATRFDYQDVDAAHGHLVIAHMGDSEVLVVSLADGSVLARVPRVGTVRGIAVGDGADRLFASAASSDQIVVVDAVTLAETARAATGRGPDGIAWDRADRVVGVSSQRSGALTLLANAGTGARTDVPLGTETGNVIFDARSRRFWITVVRSRALDQLVAVGPTDARVLERIDLPGCRGAHGLRLHPDGRSALIACEGNDVVMRVDLGNAHAVVSAPVGSGPDVLSIDPALGWLYVAAESGDVTVFDLSRPGLVDIGHEHPGPAAHSVAVDPATHRVFFPLERGPRGTPVLRIMRPGGV